MRKFRCEKCGHRIAIQPRHLGTLVRCPECGNLTHPLAEQIIERGAASATAGVSTSVAASQSDQRCENCGRAIGRLEKPREWEGQTVCMACHHALSVSDVPQPAPLKIADPPATSTAVTVARRSSRAIASPDGPPERLSRRASIRVPRGPLRAILWLIVVALAAWFVLNVVRFVSVLVNVVIVGLLLLAALWVLYQGAMNDLSEHPRHKGDDGAAK